MYTEFLRSEGLASCIFRLKVRVSYPALPELEAEFNSLDRLQVEGMAWADSCCQKFYVGAHPWSPGLADAHSKLDLMWALVRHAEGKWVSNSWIRWLQQVNQDWISWKLLVSELKDAESEAFQSYQAVLVEAP